MTGKTLGETTRRIINILYRDGRRSLVSIARELGITHVAVRKQLNKLTSTGLLKITGSLDPSKLGYRLVLVFIEAAGEEYIARIIRSLRDCPRTVFLARLLGGYNLVAILYAENEKVLDAMSSICTIRTLEGIRRTELYLLSETIRPTHLPIELGEHNLGETPCGRKCSSCPAYIGKKCPGCPATIWYRNTD